MRPTLATSLLLLLALSGCGTLSAFSRDRDAVPTASSAPADPTAPNLMLPQDTRGALARGYRRALALGQPADQESFDRFLEHASDGELNFFRFSSGRSTGVLVVGEPYYVASGAKCRRIDLVDNSGKALGEQTQACRLNGNKWHLLKALAGG